MTGQGTTARFAAIRALREHRDFSVLLAMFSLYFLVILMVGILRAVRVSLALDGLGASDFYQVYFVSGAVVLFVPLYNRLADRLPWKTLIPSVAIFFAASFIVFRLLYREGSTVFGMAFYGWYDLVAAALVTQFFIVTQLFFNARDAKRAYPLIIIGGSIGASVGGAISGFLAPRIGTPNLLFIAAGIITLFAVAVVRVWSTIDPEEGRREPVRKQGDSVSRGEFRRIFSNSHVRLIAAMVLITIVVKTMVDYEFSAIIKEVFEERDAVTSFLGFFGAATQWLPILVLLSLRPLLTRYGVAVAVLMLPAVMLLSNFGLLIAWGLYTAVAAKGADAAVRYSAERTGREILYVPVPEEIKLKAKAYIDIAVEKGVGKVVTALIIAGFLALVDRLFNLDTPYRALPFLVAPLAAIWFVAAVAVRREYVKSLALSIQGRFASLDGVFASISEATTLPIVRHALQVDDPLRTAFALDLVDRADPDDVGKVAPELHALLSHESSEIRLRALEVLARAPESVDDETVRGRLFDADPRVRKAAVHALAMAAGDQPERVCGELLEVEDARVRAATLACLGAGDLTTGRAQSLVRPFYEERLGELETADVARRFELAVASGLMVSEPGVAELLRSLVRDPDPNVASAAILSAGRLALTDLNPTLMDALLRPETRIAAREALVAQGGAAVGGLIERLNDPVANPTVRRNIPAALAGIPTQDTVEALIHSYALPETDQLLDDRALKALGKLRSHHQDLDFDELEIQKALDREVRNAATYTEAAAAVGGLDPEVESARLLARALREARHDRRASAFRWLGLVFPPEGMYRCYLAVEGGDDRSKANALEWLEQTVGHSTFKTLTPVLDGAPENGLDQQHVHAVLRGLWDGEDRWIASCAMWAMVDAPFPDIREELRRFRSDDPAMAQLADRLLGRVDGPQAGEPMDLIEKVFLLQNVDLLQGAGSAQLALLASIAEEVDVTPDTVLIRSGEPTDALYIVIRGEVELRGLGEQTLVVSEASPFGTWALIDENPSLVEARAVVPTRLLRIGRRDFHELLADHPELGLDLLQGLARRVRMLVQA